MSPGRPWRGLATQVVTGPALSATVVPSRSAKIVSLTDGHGHEWLAQAADERPRLPGPGTAFVDAEMCGWDECAPTIVACAPPGLPAVPDHGDVWDCAWQQRGDGLSVRGASLGITLERTVRATRAGLRLDYRASAAGAGAAPLLWAAHPQFTAPPGSHVQVPSAQLVDVLHHPGRVIAADRAVLGIDGLAPGGCAKFYLPPHAPARDATLVVPGRGRLGLSWDPAQVPYLGLWFDRRAYAREPVIAIEPSTGYYDRLDTAIAAGRVLQLQPGQVHHWSLALAVTATP